MYYYSHDLSYMPLFLFAFLSISFSVCLFFFSLFFRFQFFKLPLYHTDGRLSSLSEILCQLISIVEASPADLTPSLDECVGLLTSEHRDVWAPLYKKLKQCKVELCHTDHARNQVRSPVYLSSSEFCARLYFETPAFHTRLSFNAVSIHGCTTSQ